MAVVLTGGCATELQYHTGRRFWVDHQGSHPHHRHCRGIFFLSFSFLKTLLSDVRRALPRRPRDEGLCLTTAPVSQSLRSAERYTSTDGDLNHKGRVLYRRWTRPGTFAWRLLVSRHRNTERRGATHPRGRPLGFVDHALAGAVGLVNKSPVQVVLGAAEDKLQNCASGHCLAICCDLDSSAVNLISTMVPLACSMSLFHTCSRSSLAMRSRFAMASACRSYTNETDGSDDIGKSKAPGVLGRP